MMSQKFIEVFVGLFLLCAFAALTVLAFKVSGLTSLFPTEGYFVTAEFDDIGGLKVRAPVKIGGVQIGEVENIKLNQDTFKAIVKMKINAKYNDIPEDSTVGILTSGLLGDNFIALTPMYSKTFLRNGSTIEFTNSAMILEKLIGQMIYRMGHDSKEKS